MRADGRPHTTNSSKAIRTPQRGPSLWKNTSFMADPSVYISHLLIGRHGAIQSLLATNQGMRPASWTQAAKPALTLRYVHRTDRGKSFPNADMTFFWDIRNIRRHCSTLFPEQLRSQVADDPSLMGYSRRRWLWTHDFPPHLTFSPDFQSAVMESKPLSLFPHYHLNDSTGGVIGIQLRRRAFDWRYERLWSGYLRLNLHEYSGVAVIQRGRHSTS